MMSLLQIDHKGDNTEGVHFYGNPEITNSNIILVHMTLSSTPVGHTKVLSRNISAESDDALGGVLIDERIVATEKGSWDIDSQRSIKGVDVNSEDDLGQTAFHQAAANGHLELCKNLIQSGAKANIRDLCGKTGLEYAAGNGHREAVKELINDYITDNADEVHDEATRALYYAADGGHVDIVEDMINKKGNPNFPREGHWNALHRAAAQGHKDVVSLLVDHGASLDAPGNAGKTALCEAAANGHEAIVEYLLGKGAKADAQGNGNTALHAAIEGPKFLPSMFKLLLSKSTNKDTTNLYGETALHIAAGKGLLEAVQALCSNQISINIRREDGMTALDIAKKEVTTFDIAEKKAACIAKKTGRRTKMQYYEAKKKCYEEICDQLRSCGAIET